MSKKNKKQDIKLETDYTQIGLIIAVGLSVSIILVSVFMIYISTPPEKIYAARVNGQPITRDEFDKAVNATKRQYMQLLKMDFNNPNGEKMLENIKKNSLDSLINRQILIQASKNMNVSVDQSEIEADIEKIKKENFKGDEKAFRDALKGNGLTLEQLRASFEKDKLVEKVKKQITDEKVKITDKDMRDYYDKNKSEFGTPEKVKASHILVKEESKAKEIYDQLQEDSSKFSELAKKFSTDPGSKDKGGDLGFFGKGQMVPEFEKKSWELKQDEIGEPVKSQFGYHIIKRTGFEAAKTDPYEKVKDKIKDTIKQKKSNEVIEKFIKEEKEKAKIEIFEASSKVQATPTPAASAQTSGSPSAQSSSTSSETTPVKVNVSTAPASPSNDKKEETKKIEQPKEEVSAIPSKQ